MTYRRLSRGLIGLASACALCFSLAACSDPGEAYLELQSSIQGTLTREGLSVSWVACKPHVGQLAWSDPPAHLTCFIRFKDGSSYATPATVQPVVDQPDMLTWNGPPAGMGQIDITRAPLPVPSLSVAATSPTSLFYRRNLSPIVQALAKRFRGQSIVQLAIYPGELEAVIANEGEARLVTAGAGGQLGVSSPSAFSGPRKSIFTEQLRASVPELLAHRISQADGVSTTRLARFVLRLGRENARWEIYALAGSTRFEALLDGEGLEAISASGRRPLD